MRRGYKSWIFGVEKYHKLSRLKKMLGTNGIRGGGKSKIDFFDFSKKYAESKKVF